MGGIGSGRQWYHCAKDVTGDYISIDVRQWQRQGLLAPYQSFTWRWSCDDESIASIGAATKPDSVILRYCYRSDSRDWETETYPIYLEWTPCHFGERRPWFLCPATGCGRRVAILYGGSIFACRHCLQLAYRSQRETAAVRADRQAEKICHRLGWDPYCPKSVGYKPKGMHTTTFNQLTARYDAYAAKNIDGFLAYLEKHFPDGRR